MGGLYKKEVLIRPSSGVSVPAAINWVNGWLDRFYTAEGNEDNFFADIFDPRGNHSRVIRVFHTGCMAKYGLTSDQLVYTITGDPADGGADDQYLDVEDGGDTGGHFVLSESEEFTTLKGKVNTLEGEHEQNTGSVSDEDVVRIMKTAEAFTTLEGKVSALEDIHAHDAVSITESDVMRLIRERQTDSNVGGLIERIIALEAIVEQQAVLIEDMVASPPATENSADDVDLIDIL